MFGFVAIAVVLLALVVASLWAYRQEKKTVMEGHCGLPWQSWDVDSSGAVGLKCQKCGNLGPFVSWYTKGIVMKRGDL